jgi:hypothetical protein
MNNITRFFPKSLFLMSFLVFSLSGLAQHFTVDLANMTTTSDTFEVDVMLTIDAPSQGVRLKGFSTGINYNTAILNGGTPCTEIDCGSWSLITGSTAPELTVNGNAFVWRLTNRASPVGHLRVLQNGTCSVDVLPGTYRMGRFKFINSVNWVPESDAQLWLQPSNLMGSTNTNVIFSAYGSDSLAQTYTTTNPAGGTGLTLIYTQASTFHGVPLNSALGLISNESVSEIVTAYPNPFQDVFKLSMNATSSEAVDVQVYDMLGKRIEDFNLEATRMNDIQIGQNYPSGFYNLKVSQCIKTQCIRMIKQ